MHARSLISLGSLLLLTACSTAPKTEQTAVTSPANGASPAPVAIAQNFSKPVVSPAAPLPVPTVPGLITSTNARMRVPTIVTGRTDPFAAVSTAPIRLIAATSKPAVTLPSPLPAPSQAQLPTFSQPLAPAPVNLTPLPPALPQLPVSRTASADAIEISGVIKVGSRWSVIVKEPEAQSSRYVHAGAYLANGQVLVKRIVANAGSDPIVILQQNGIEITRTIGGSARLASK